MFYSNKVDVLQTQCVGFVVVLAHVDRFLFEVFEHHFAKTAHLGFGITHCSRAVSIHGTEVSLATYKRIAKRKVLSHTNKRIVSSSIAMRMVLTDDFTHNTGRLHRRLVGCQTELVHRVQNAAVNGFQTVTHVREGASHNHAHRITQIAVLHIPFDEGLVMSARS